MLDAVPAIPAAQDPHVRIPAHSNRPELRLRRVSHSQATPPHGHAWPLVSRGAYAGLRARARRAARTGTVPQRIVRSPLFTSLNSPSQRPHRVHRVREIARVAAGTGACNLSDQGCARLDCLPRPALTLAHGGNRPLWNLKLNTIYLKYIRTRFQSRPLLSV